MRPKTIKFILVFFNTVMLSSPGWSQCNGCNFQFVYMYSSESHFLTLPSSVEYYDCEETIIYFSDCNQDDVQFLIELINQNDIDNSSTSFDINDGDDIFEPNELGQQIWENGRLIHLDVWGERGFWYEYGNQLWSTHLYGYNITSIPENISNLDQLKYLDIFNNPILSLPQSFGQMNSLEYLWYGGDDSIDKIPEPIWNLENLKFLDISGIDITNIPDEVNNLTKLEVMVLEQNSSLSTFPKNISCLLNLKKLKLLNIDLVI